MRKLAMSMNQFGMDMLRHQGKSNLEHHQQQPTNIALCPFCVGSSLAMVLAGLWPDQRDMSAYESLRYALYLNSMQPQEIHLAIYDLMRHLQVNMPEGVRMKRSTLDKTNIDNNKNNKVNNKNLPENVKMERSMETTKSEENSNKENKENSLTPHPDSLPGLFIDDETGGVEPLEDEGRSPATLRSNTVHLVNNVYIQRYLPVDYEYYVLMQQYYRTPIRSLDFAFAPEESRQHINSMVEHATDGKVLNLLPADDDDDDQSDGRDLVHRHFWPTTKLLLLSALYFDGQLDLREHSRRRSKISLPFFKSRGGLRPRPGPPPPPPLISHAAVSHRLPPTVNTTVVRTIASTTSTTTARPAIITTTASSPMTTVLPNPSKTFNPFKPLSGSSKIVSRESMRLRYAFNTYLNATAVEMPFVGGILSLVVLVPGDGRSLESILSRLNAQLLADVVQNLEIQRLDITIPSLNVAHSIPDMEQMLSRMGLASVFNDRQSEVTTFAGINAFPLAQVTRIHHKTMLNIDMEATATAKRKRRQADEGIELVASPVIRVFGPTKTTTKQRRPESMKQLSGAESNVKPSYTRPILTNVVSSSSMPSPTSSTKRRYVNLDDQSFLYFILDNISGLVLVMGKYEQPA